jgi:hypothetical protein
MIVKRKVVEKVEDVVEKVEEVVEDVVDVVEEVVDVVEEVVPHVKEVVKMVDKAIDAIEPIVDKIFEVCCDDKYEAQPPEEEPQLPQIPVMKEVIDNSLIKELKKCEIREPEKQLYESGCFDLQLECEESALFHIQLKTKKNVKQFQYQIECAKNFIHSTHIQSVNKNIVSVYCNNLTNLQMKFKLHFNCCF